MQPWEVSEPAQQFWQQASQHAEQPDPGTSKDFESEGQRSLSRPQSSLPPNSVLQGFGDRQLPGPVEAPAGARQRGGLKHFMV